MATGCACGCSEMTLVTQAKEPCGCGCDCCTDGPKPAEEEIADLLVLNDAIVKRLAELGVV